MGLGQSLDIGLKNESGNLPTEDQYAGAGIGNLALGQDKVETTPLQIAQMMTIIANNGIKKDLSLIKAIIDQAGKTVKTLNERLEGGQRVIDYNTAQELKSWMLEVTKYGTGKKAYSKKQEEVQEKLEPLRYLEILKPNIMVGLQVFFHKQILNML